MFIPEFDALYAISDLHMGGKTGFQIFKEGKLLAEFIRSLAAPPPKGSIVLVINGDLVDFLAEAPARYLDPEGAITKLERITQDPAFAPVFDALAEYVKVPGCHLAWVLGNHDVELALPPVEGWLVERLTGGDAGARGRIFSALSGAGFNCRVGGKRVLCMHGNEVDDWNVIDYLALLQTARALNRGVAPPEWDACAGTRMVIDIMNDIKREYPFIDLLKPETEAALPTVVAIAPKFLKKVSKLPQIAGTKLKDHVRREMGLLGAEEQAGKTPPSDQELARQFLGQAFGELPPARSTTSTGALLRQAQERIDRGVDPKDVATATGEELLGVGDWFNSTVDALTERKPELLRKALLKWLAGDPTFALDNADDQFKALDAKVGTEVDYLLTGHTHLARALRRKGGTFYFNSGTWVRLMQLSPAALEDEKSFRGIYEVLEGSRTLTELDAAKDPATGKELVFTRPCVVKISKQGKRTVGELAVAHAGGVLEPIEGGRFPEG
jgi:UDP-2,3-diacylglucosamine pyrophosphatase LpxH